jgi:hypothetical protein
MVKYMRCLAHAALLLALVVALAASLADAKKSKKRYSRLCTICATKESNADRLIIVFAWSV